MLSWHWFKVGQTLINCEGSREIAKSIEITCEYQITTCQLQRRTGYNCIDESRCPVHTDKHIALQ